MCETCNDLVDVGNDTLNELIDHRRNRGPTDSPSREEMLSANAFLHSLDPEEVRESTDVQVITLALAVAVERLAVLEESVIE